MVTNRELTRDVGRGPRPSDGAPYGYSLALLLLVGGVVALIAAALVHWVLVVVGVVAIAVGLYLFAFGGMALL
ncbi:MAG: hypothetical protein L3J92_03850 [Thermoplasmata archaeon]|nr:hypothetical protein [Thermoplasmata archaeon]